MKMRSQAVVVVCDIAIEDVCLCLCVCVCVCVCVREREREREKENVREKNRCEGYRDAFATEN